MNETLFWVVATLMFIVLVWLLFRELVVPVPQTGKVKGTVSYGGDVSGVTMTLEQGGEIKASILTDAAGAYAFADELAIGGYTLKAHKDVPEGFLTAELYVDVVGGENIVPDLPLARYW